SRWSSRRRNTGRRAGVIRRSLLVTRRRAGDAAGETDRASVPGRHVIGAASRVRGCTPSGAAYGLPPSTVAVRPWSAPRAGRGGSEPGLRRRGRETAVRAWTARVRCLPYAVSRRGGG